MEKIYTSRAVRWLFEHFTRNTDKNKNDDRTRTNRQKQKLIHAKLENRFKSKDERRDLQLIMQNIFVLILFCSKAKGE